MEYLTKLIYIFKKNRISSNENKNIKKSRKNKIIEILAKLKDWNLSKS